MKLMNLAFGLVVTAAVHGVASGMECQESVSIMTRDCHFTGTSTKCNVKLDVSADHSDSLRQVHVTVKFHYRTKRGTELTDTALDSFFLSKNQQKKEFWIKDHIVKVDDVEVYDATVEETSCH